MKTFKIIAGVALLAITALTVQSFTSNSRSEVEIIKPVTANIADLKGNWEVDPVHSQVQFSVTHLVISEVDGSFKVYSGDINLNDNDLSNAKFNFEIDAKSINTGVDARDEHLRSEDFFNTEKYRTISFKSTKVKKSGKDNYAVTGNLTIREVTKPITFTLKYGGVAVDGYGNTKAGFKANATIDRFDYGLKWNALTEAGGMTVSNEVEIDLNLQYSKAK